MSRSTPASFWSASSTARNWSRSMICRRWRASSRAAGDGRHARLAMRLLHAGLHHVAVHALPVRQGADAGEIVDHIAGNLCRCTGYRPIVDAALAACNGSPAERWASGADFAARMLASLDDGADVFVGTPDSFIARPARAGTLAQLAADNPDATIVSGATDVGLWITKQMRNLPKIILTGGVKSLHAISDEGDLCLDRCRRHLCRGLRGIWAPSTPMCAKCCGGSVRRRCGPRAPSAAISPMALPSATCRRC